MRIKILLLGDNPASLVADAQFLRERGIMVITSFNLDNTKELIEEIKPDLMFFDAHKSNNKITDAYNDVINGAFYANIPVIFTLSEDDVYLVTRKRTETKRSLIADNMIDAIKMALEVARPKAPKNIIPHTGTTGKPHNGHKPGGQMQIPFH